MTTTEPQPEQPTEQIDGEVDILIRASATLPWPEVKPIAISVSKRLAGPSLTVIEKEIRRTIEGWEDESYKADLFTNEQNDLVDRLRDTFQELMEGKME